MKPTITWIVLADGAHARFVEHRGPNSRLIEHTGLALSREPVRAGDINSDRPGRAFATSGRGRSAMEPPTDPVAKLEADFMRQVAKSLGEALAANKFDRLIVVAAPQALGDLRKALPAAVAAKVTAELPKDLVHEPVNALPRHFEKVLAV